MDLKKLTATVLSSDSLKGLSSLTGASKGDVSSVLTEALPTLLGGADKQAKGAKTAKGFAEALTQHAKDDTGSLSKFFGKVDLGDGAKIIGHLLGNRTDSVTEKVSQKTGVSADKVGAILSAAGPLLMSLLGQQKEEEEKEEKPSGLGGLFGGLLQNVDLGGLLGGILTSDEEEEEEPAEEKKKKKTTAKKKTSTTAKKTTSAAKKKTTSTAKKKTSTTAKKTTSAAKKKTTSTAKKTTSTAKKTGATAKKTSATAKKASTATKKTAAKK